MSEGQRRATEIFLGALADLRKGDDVAMRWFGLKPALDRSADASDRARAKEARRLMGISSACAGRSNPVRRQG